MHRWRSRTAWPKDGLVGKAPTGKRPALTMLKSIFNIEKLPFFLPLPFNLLLSQTL